MAITWKDGSILWEAGSIANSTACCCAAPSTPISCTPCTVASTPTAPPYVIVTCSGWTAATGDCEDYNDTFICGTPLSGAFCNYSYASGSLSILVALSKTEVRIRFSGTGSIFIDTWAETPCNSHTGIVIPYDSAGTGNCAQSGPTVTLTTSV